MNNSIYYDSVYFDAEWALHHLVSKLVGAVYSGIVSTARHFMRFLDFIIEPRGVTIEQIWNGTGASDAFSLSITPPVVKNACLVVCMDIFGSVTPTSMTWNSITLTRRIHETAASSPYVCTAIYAAVIPEGSLGVASNLASVGGTFSNAYVTAYLCSGVNQTTAVIATGTAPGSTTEPHSITLAASVANGMAFECGIIATPAFGSVGAGQTAQPDTTTPYGSYKATTGANTVMTHTLTQALSRNSMSAVALQPA